MWYGSTWSHTTLFRWSVWTSISGCVLLHKLGIQARVKINPWEFHLSDHQRVAALRIQRPIWVSSPPKKLLATRENLEDLPNGQGLNGTPGLWVGRKQECWSWCVFLKPRCRRCGGTLLQSRSSHISKPCQVSKKGSCTARPRARPKPEIVTKSFLMLLEVARNWLAILGVIFVPPSLANLF